MPFRLRLRNTQNTQIWNVPETAEEQKRAGRKKMKILSIAVPCYNSEAYMEKCIDSLLVGGEEVEILIVDDGSKDGTTEIADRYQEKYPTIVKAIHQKNKGHGGAVNTGVENATGLYFKVVDSDDWVNPEAYHSLIYRTSLLRECGMKLPEHTFYVDNLVAFIPLPYVKTMYYLDVNFYRYFIGRADQSVNEKVMIGRIDQQIRVNKLMIDYLGEQKGLSKYLRKYMISYLTIIMTVSSVMMMRSGTEENLEKKNDLWRYLKQEDAADYFRIRHGIFGTVMSSKSKPGQKIAVYAYKVAQKLYGFN